MNEALSELYIEDEDHEKLRESVDDYDNFDQVTWWTIFRCDFPHTSARFSHPLDSLHMKVAVLTHTGLVRVASVATFYSLRRVHMGSAVDYCILMCQDRHPCLGIVSVSLFVVLAAAL